MIATTIVKLVKIWKNHDIRSVTKLYLIKTLIFPVITYGSETWTLSTLYKRKKEAY